MVILTGMTGAVSGNLTVPMGVLVGDNTADSSVNSADIGLVKSKSGTSLSVPLRRR